MTDGDPGGRAVPQGRRELAYALLLCATGAGLALFAATRSWAVELTVRPAPLPAVRVVRTGADLVPWLPAVAVVGLAGAGAVIATRGVARRAVGVLLLALGLGVAAGGGYGLALADGVAWPALGVVGGLLVAAGGALTLAWGRRWPTMGARYERVATGAPGPGDAASRDERSMRQSWDALDRGEDPTVS